MIVGRYAPEIGRSPMVCYSWQQRGQVLNCHKTQRRGQAPTTSPCSRAVAASVKAAREDAAADLRATSVRGGLAEVDADTARHQHGVQVHGLRPAVADGDAVAPRDHVLHLEAERDVA